MTSRPTQEDALWSLQSVSLQGHHARLDDVNLTVRTGVTAVLGASGAGKSSLLNLLVEFERPTHGTVQRVAVGSRPLPIAWAPQSPALWPHLTALEHLQAVQPATAPASIAFDWLVRFDLADHAHVIPQELSAGQQSRLTVARSLACETDVVVLDEPLSNVAPAQVSTYWTVIAEHFAKAPSVPSKSLVFASHALDPVFQLAQHVVGLHEGRIVFDGTLADLYERPPDRTAAELLGPVSWFATGQAVHWIEGADGVRCAYRPEQLSLHGVPASPLRVESWQFLGATAIVALRHMELQEVRQVRCRSPHALRPGQSVQLRCGESKRAESG